MGGIVFDELNTVSAEFLDRSDLCDHARVQLRTSKVSHDDG